MIILTLEVCLKKSFVLSFLILCITVTSFAEEQAREWPFSKFYSTYSIDSCKGSVKHIDCSYKQVKIFAGDHTDNGRVVPTANFKFANNMKTGAFSESSYMNQRNATYTGSDSEGNFKQSYNDEIGKNLIAVTMQKNKDNKWTLTFTTEKIPKDGASTKNTAVFVLTAIKE